MKNQIKNIFDIRYKELYKKWSDFLSVRFNLLRTILEKGYSKFKALIKDFSEILESAVKIIFGWILAAIPKIVSAFRKIGWGAIITLFLTIITNQIAQPLIFPRLSTFSVTPTLYVQSQDSYYDGEPQINYYKIFKITYTIEPALFREPQYLKLKLPGKLDIFQPIHDIELITQMRELSPYANIILPEKLKGTNFISTNELNNELEVQINTNGLNVKSFFLNLYFREKTEVDTRRQTSSLHRWYSTSTVAPEKPIILDEHSTDRNIYGILYRENEKNAFLFWALTLTNKNEFDIREYWIHLPKDARVCEGDSELSTRNFKESSYVAVDLTPQQSRKFLIFERINSSEIILPETIVNLTTLWCGDLSNKIR